MAKKSPTKNRLAPRLQPGDLAGSTSVRVFWGLAISFFILGFLLYAPSISYDFVYDDDAVLKENRFVKNGMDGLSEIWTTSYFKGYDENMNARAFRPIPLTMFALEVEAFGLKSKVHHFMNVLLYGFTGLFLFLFLARLFKKEQIWLAACITLFFVVHPVHVEVIANIKSRDELVAFLAFVATAFLWLKGQDENKKVLIGASWVTFAIALFSKESAITTLAVFPLLLWFFRKKSFKQIALAVLPFLILTIAFLAVRSAVVGGLNEGVTLTILDNSLLAASSTSERIASNIYVLGLYFYKNLIPYPLLSDYSFSTIPLRSWGDYQVWLSIALYLGLISLAVVGLFKKWKAAYGAWHFFATVSIFSSVIVLNVSPYNDRFNYNPSLGVCFLLGFGLFYLLGEKEGKLSFPGRQYLLISLVSLIALAGMYRQSTHLPVWKDRYVLFDHDVQLAPNNARMLKNKGGSLVRKAVAEKDKSRQQAVADEAISYLERALAIYHRLPTSHVYLGIMYGLKGELEKAEKAYKDALAISSTNVYAKTNLANIYYRQGNYQDALNLLNEVKPELYSANDKYLLYLIYTRLGDYQTAMQWKEQSGR
jgi:Tfp pilus assembly protein PilF